MCVPIQTFGNHSVGLYRLEFRMSLYPLTVYRHPDSDILGRAAGTHASRIIVAAIAKRGMAQVMLAAAPSQEATLAVLATSNIDFTRVTFFHMDDYVGLPPSAPQGFGNWLERTFFSQLPTEFTFHRIDTSLPAAESAVRYTRVLGTEPFDLTLCGLGVNGHLAFNDPPADFSDNATVRPVYLSEQSRQQQVDEGHFPSLSAVPCRAITVTIPRLLHTRYVICSVSGQRKRQAVTDTLGNNPNPQFPGTALQLHPDVHLYIDTDSDPESDSHV